MPSKRWVVQREREELGQSIKKMVNNVSEESLGYRCQKIMSALKIIEKDGRFTKEGIQSLVSVETLIHQVMNYKGEKQNENA